MLVVETIARIRRDHLVRGVPIKKIARDLRVSKNTVRKVVRGDETSYSYERKIQPMPKLGPWVDELERQLEANEKKPRRDRLSLLRIHEDLAALGYGGGYDAVRRYARTWRRRWRLLSPSQGFVPLSFDPGEAYQFDWSHEYARLSGVTTKVKAAHMRLCYSRMQLVQIFPRESQEMVFEAHERAFHFFGGVCRRGIYDNMKTAVSMVFVGKERAYNRRFLELCSHHLVEPVACTPGAGWEKGQVERQVGDVRGRLFVPIPRGRSYVEINEWLMDRCIEDAKKRPHPTIESKTVNGGAKRDHRGGVRRDHLAAAGLSPSPWEGPACDAACPQQADAAARAGGTCGPTGSSVGWVVGSVRRRGLTPAALVEPVALAIHLEDVDVVGEAVEESAGEALGAEHLGPFVEGQIGGDQGRAPLVALAEHLEQELGTGLGQRHEAEFVDDQKLVGGELLLEPQQLLVIAGLDELVDQCGGGDEADREALLAGRQAETEGDVGLAGAAVAERDEVLAALDVLAAGQLQDQRLVERGDDLEVEAIEALDHGEARRLDAPLDHAALAVDQLELGKTQKIANVVDAFRGTLPGDLVVLPQERRQLQPLEVVDEQHLPCVGHAPSPDSRLMYDLADVVATRARGRYG